MTTCMETWMAADRSALRDHFGQGLRPERLPPLTNLERRARGEVQRGLENATRSCAAPYTKGPRSFDALGKLSPDTLESHLPSFKRTRRILNDRLG